MEAMSVWCKQVSVVLDKKTETKKFKYKGMLKYIFYEKRICKTGIYS